MNKNIPPRKPTIDRLINTINVILDVMSVVKRDTIKEIAIDKRKMEKLR
jgi:hypothetical protein